MSLAQEIVRRQSGRWYGGEHGYGYIRCPVHKDKHPSCSVRDGESGVPLVNCKVGCSRVEIIEALKREGSWPETDRPSQRRVPRRQSRRYATASTASPRPRVLSEQEQQRVAFARSIWVSTVAAPGTIVERYWREARGLILPLPKAVRFGKAVSYGNKPDAKRYPAMVAGIQAPDDAFAGVHCTFLLPDGSDKESLPADRLIFGVVGGCAVRLSDAAEEMCIGEGIETTGSYMQELHIAGWAGMNTSGLQNIILPPLPLGYLVSILVDNDDGGERASANAAARLRLEGRSPTLVRPAEGFNDFNDPHRRAA